MAASQAGKTTITRRYAASLFDYLNSDKVQKGKVDAVENELQQLAQAIEEDAALTRRLSGPLLSKDALEKILEGVAKAVSLSSATKEFCRVLIRNRRFHLLPQIARAFSAQTAEARGEVTADVVSAVALGSKESKQLAATLEKSTGKRVTLNQRVDDSLLGGMRVTVGSVMVDASLVGKLQRLKLHLKQTEDFQVQPVTLSGFLPELVDVNLTLRSRHALPDTRNYAKPAYDIGNHAYNFTDNYFRESFSTTIHLKNVVE